MSRMRNRAFSMLSVSRSGSAGPMVTLGIGSGWLPLCRAGTGLAGIAALDLVDPIAVQLFRAELQVKALAHDTGQETPYRVLLPTRGLGHRVDGGTHRRSQHCNDMRLLGARLPLFRLALVLALLCCLGGGNDCGRCYSSFLDRFRHWDPPFGLGGLCRGTTEAPPRRESRRGRISEHSGRPGLTVSTARIAADCQSFLQGTLQVNADVWSHSATACPGTPQE